MLNTSIRFLALLTMVVWIGGIIFFAFLVAPTLFAMLPTQQLAGQVVNRLLSGLHDVGLVCGVVFLIASGYGTLKRARVARALCGAMILCTAASQLAVIPKMQRLRESVGGAIEALPASDAGRAAFDHLHRISVGLEIAVLIGGIVILAILARTAEKPRSNTEVTEQTPSSPQRHGATEKQEANKSSA